MMVVGEACAGRARLCALARALAVVEQDRRLHDHSEGKLRAITEAKEAGDKDRLMALEAEG